MQPLQKETTEINLLKLFVWVLNRALDGEICDRLAIEIV